MSRPFPKSSLRERARACSIGCNHLCQGNRGELGGSEQAIKIVSVTCGVLFQPSPETKRVAGNLPIAATYADVIGAVTMR